MSNIDGKLRLNRDGARKACKIRDEINRAYNNSHTRNERNQIAN